MNQILKIMDDAKQITGKVQMTLTSGTGSVAEGVERAEHENHRRATEIGPVLEEILQNHWRHWGLNE